MSVVVDKLSYSHNPGGHDALRNIGFSLNTGSFTAVLGPNGSGKTTLLRCLAGLSHNENLRGSIQLFQKSTKELSQIAHSLAATISYIPGTLDTSFDIDVKSFVMQSRFYRQNFFSAPTHEDHTAARRALDAVGLTAMAHVSVCELSSGEKQLALLARGLAQGAKILLVDETIANLDLHFQLTVMRALKNEASSGTLILLVSHDVNLVSEFCQQALWLKNGELIASGPLKTTLNKDLLRLIYPDKELSLGENPFTGATKIFFNPH